VSSLFKSKKTEKQETQIDPRVYNEVLQNLGLARQVSQIPFQPYGGMMVAPFTQDYMRGEQMTRDIASQGGFVPEIEAAARSAYGLMGYQPQQVGAERVGTQFTPQQVAAQQLGTTFGARDIGAALGRGPERVTAGQVGSQFAAPTAQAASFLGRNVGGDLNAYMNPYQQGVIDVGLSDIDRASEQARMQRGARATAARAFGGSRAAIEEGIAAGEAARERNRFVAEQRAQSFREAAGLREADVGREQQAMLANQAAQQQAQQMGLTAEQFNVEQALRGGMANQQAVQQYMQMGLSAEQANQAANLDAQRLGFTAGQANQEAALRAALANQQAGMQGQQLGLQAQGMNQEAALLAARSNQQAGLQGAQFQLGAGAQLGSLGQQALQNRYGAAGAMTGLGSAQQNLMQQYLNAQQQEFMRRVNYPLQQLAVAQGAVAASPFNQTTLGTTTSRPNYWQIAGQVIPAAAAAFSDEDMKYNIKPIKNPLDKVKRLEGVTFNWKDDDVEDASIIAQDVEKVMPDAVGKADNGMRMVDMTKMVGLLTGAVQELDKKVERKSRKRKSV
jgi:hypothetical protein